MKDALFDGLSSSRCLPSLCTISFLTALHAQRTDLGAGSMLNGTGSVLPWLILYTD